jgi:hypothetical protein
VRVQNFYLNVRLLHDVVLRPVMEEMSTYISAKYLSYIHPHEVFRYTNHMINYLAIRKSS